MKKACFGATDFLLTEWEVHQLYACLDWLLQTIEKLSKVRNFSKIKSIKMSLKNMVFYNNSFQVDLMASE